MSVSGSYLLDTNIVIAFFSGEPAVIDQFAQADEILLSSIVLGELAFGARKSSRASENLARIEDLSQQVVVLNCDSDTARQYGIIKHALRLKGRPIPDNDIWIAAIARQYQLTLITRDAHFTEVDDLLSETW
jgi:tRNA(fMet)-specific endonuclease VapC